MQYMTAFHPIEETLRSGRAEGRIYISGSGPRIKAITALAAKAGIAVRTASPAELTRMAPDNRGIVFESTAARKIKGYKLVQVGGSMEAFYRLFEGKDSVSGGVEGIEKAYRFLKDFTGEERIYAGETNLLFLFKPTKFMILGKTKDSKRDEYRFLKEDLWKYLPRLSADEYEKASTDRLMGRDFLNARREFPEPLRNLNFTMIRVTALIYCEILSHKPKIGKVIAHWYSVNKVPPTEIRADSNFYTSITGRDRDLIIDNRSKLIERIKMWKDGREAAAKLDE